MRQEEVLSVCDRVLSSTEASSITKPSFTDQHHGQQPGSCVAVLRKNRHGAPGAQETNYILPWKSSVEVLDQEPVSLNKNEESK